MRDFNARRETLRITFFLRGRMSVALDRLEDFTTTTTTKRFSFTLVLFFFVTLAIATTTTTKKKRRFEQATNRQAELQSFESDEWQIYDILLHT